MWSAKLLTGKPNPPLIRCKQTLSRSHVRLLQLAVAAALVVAMKALTCTAGRAKKRSFGAFSREEEELRLRLPKLVCPMLHLAEETCALSSSQKQLHKQQVRQRLLARVQANCLPQRTRHLREAAAVAARSKVA